jgi:hypothetical protein
MAGVSDPKRTSESDRAQQASHEADRAQANAGQSAQHPREAGERGAFAAARATDAIAEAARSTTEQGQQALDTGIRLMAGAHAPLVDAGYQQSRRVIESSAHITNAYREATERSAEDAQALIAAGSNIGRGLQHWQQACFDLLGQSMERGAQRRQALQQCNSVVEFAQFQRDVYLDMMDGWFTSSTTLLQLAGQIAHDAVRPLQDRARDSRRG